MGGRMTKAWRRAAYTNALLLATSLTAVAVHQSGPVTVAADTEVSVDEGLRLIAAQAASYSFFLTFEGTANVPKGEATSPADAVVVRSFALGVENPLSIAAASGGAGTNKVKFNELKITKAVDASSPSMFTNLTSGGHMRQLTLTVRRAGVQPPADYLIWQFGLVYFQRMDWSGQADGLTETVVLNYGSLRISYARNNAAGTLDPPKAGQWNQVTNSPNYVAS